jgi:hypothetical protein
LNSSMRTASPISSSTTNGLFGVDRLGIRVMRRPPLRSVSVLAIHFGGWHVEGSRGAWMDRGWLNLLLTLPFQGGVEEVGRCWVGVLMADIKVSSLFSISFSDSKEDMKAVRSDEALVRTALRLAALCTRVG